jgi:uncharacterized protein YhjY with autotransporter beta-barrel domain
MNRIRSVLASAIALATLLLVLPLAAGAQSRSAATVAAFTAVDGGGNGGPGCGGAGASGNNLTNAINTTFGTPGFDDEGVAVASRRQLYRLCDSRTGTGANGWTGDAAAIPTEQQNATSTEYAPEEIFTSMDDSKAIAELQVANVARRLTLIRVARRSDRAANEALARRDPTRPAAFQNTDEPSAGRGPVGRGSHERGEQVLLALQEGINAGDDLFGIEGLSAFVNGRINVVDGDGNEAERSSEGFGGGFTIGVDKFLGDDLFLGGAFGYTRIDTNYASSASEADLDAVSFSVYGAWYPTDALYVDGSVSTSWLGLDSSNEVVVFDGGPPVGTLDGSTDGVNFGVDVGTGYGFQIEQVEGLVLEPYLRVSVLYTEIDGFEQRGGDSSLNLGIRTQKATSVTANLGGRVEYPVSTRLGVLTPYARVAYVHEFANENDDISATPTATGSGGPSFKLNAQATDSHYANVGLGVSATLGEGLSQFVDYDGIVLHDNVAIHQVTIGVRLEF